MGKVHANNHADVDFNADIVFWEWEDHVWRPDLIPPKKHVLLYVWHLLKMIWNMNMLH